MIVKAFDLAAQIGIENDPTTLEQMEVDLGLDNHGTKMVVMVMHPHTMRGCVPTNCQGWVKRVVDNATIFYTDIASCAKEIKVPGYGTFSIGVNRVSGKIGWSLRI